MKRTVLASEIGGGPPAATEEEQELIARLAAGEEGEPMRAICNRYARPLHGFGSRVLGDSGMAEEMVQDTFVRLWRSAGRYDPERGSVRTFIYAIARNASIDLRRRTASRPLLTRPGDEVRAAEPATMPSDEVTDLALELEDALEGLSEKHRVVLELHFRQDLSQQQIAERLRIPLGTVKTRAFHGLKALRGELEGRGLVG